MKHVLVIGGGIIGLSSAFYLKKAGHKVTVVDKAGFTDNCSYGNLGYVCPSHFIPLATPGIVWQGLKWMMNSRSPFYVQPSLDRTLIDWGLKFMRSATLKKVESAAVPLKEIAVLSQQEYAAWQHLPGFRFAYEHKGILEVFQTEKLAHHAAETVATARRLGLDVDLLNRQQLTDVEPQQWNALGAIFFKCDAHLYPDALMSSLKNYLPQQGVRFVTAEVTGFQKKGRAITGVLTRGEVLEADAIVVATGSWSRQMAALLGARIPLVPGRGYSFTLEDTAFRLSRPVILTEGRVAMSLMDGNKMRFGGTMEIVNTSTPPRYHRVEGILQAIKRFLPLSDIPKPPEDKIWYGYRPTSADGLPYIGRIRKYNNVVVATGHSMIGLSLGAGTGKLVSELVSEQKPSLDLSAFEVERFG